MIVNDVVRCCKEIVAHHTPTDAIPKGHTVIGSAQQFIARLAMPERITPLDEELEYPCRWESGLDLQHIRIGRGSMRLWNRIIVFPGFLRGEILMLRAYVALLLSRVLPVVTHPGTSGE